MEVFIIAALSADGFIAPPAVSAGAALSTAWTGPEDKKRFVAATKEAGVLVLGRPTFETFGARPLKGRLAVVHSRTPPAGAPRLEDPAGWPAALSQLASRARMLTPLAAFISPPSDPRTLVPPEGAVLWTTQDPAAVRAALERLGFSGLAVCGGAEVYRLWQESGLVERWRLTVEPRFFGEGVRLFAPGSWTAGAAADAAGSEAFPALLELVSVEARPGGAVFLDYRRPLT